jgi:ureidoacrylate peracid hydrolase
MKTPHKLTRRHMLAAMAASSLGGVTSGSAGTQADTASRVSPSTTSRRVSIDARPEPITIDTARTAVIVVDMQNDFGAKGGMFDRAGIDLSGIRKAIAPTAQALAAARRAGIKVVYLKMAFRPDLSDLGAPDSPNRIRHRPFDVGKTVRAPDGSEGRILIRDTWNTDILPELKPQAGDVVIYKHRFSGFFETDLDARLKELGIKHLIITGCTTSVCVEATVRDAMFRDYACVLLTDCMSQPTLGNTLPGSNHDASLVVIAVFFGWLSSSNDLTKALGDA